RGAWGPADPRGQTRRAAEGKGDPTSMNTLAHRAGAALTRIACAVLLAAAPAQAQQDIATAEQKTTLEVVRERGHLICGASDPLPGFAQRSEEGLWSGFDVDLCRAIAAAVLGDAEKVEFRSLTGDARFAQLQIGA